MLMNEQMSMSTKFLSQKNVDILLWLQLWPVVSSHANAFNIFSFFYPNTYEQQYFCLIVKNYWYLLFNMILSRCFLFEYFYFIFLHSKAIESEKKIQNVGSKMAHLVLNDCSTLIL